MKEGYFLDLKKAFLNICGHEFKDMSLLKTALTHSSFANEMHGKIKYNERLEFLGDSVLSLVISEFLFARKDSLAEGEMSKTRANIVCERSLAESASEINLGEYIYLGKGEELTGGRERPSILADAMEALIAALYLDGGFECAKKFVLDKLDSQITDALGGNYITDYKTALQEYIQGKSNGKISYQLILEEGPDHNKVFTTSLLIDGKEFKRGVGKTKKDSEQLAAKKALADFGVLR